MSNIEIEDVLSSIRRLVSEDMRPAARLPRAPQPLAGPGKLVLTPALRIVPAKPDLPDDPDEPAAAANVVEAAVAALPQDWEPDGSEFVARFAADPDDDWSVEWVSARHSPNNAAAPQPAEPEPEPEPEPQSEPDAPQSDAPVPLQTAICPPDDLAAAEPAPAASAPDRSEWQGAGFAAAPTRGEGLHSGYVASAHLPEPALQPDVIDWQDDLPSHSPASPADVAPPADPTVLLDAEDGSDEGGWLDEDALRDLVRDMIREELQGTLGERITRNVRKLVRAEINRALATRDLD